ncbi:hypothetical protein ABT061_15790 [Streptosporangium sp. NPDC002544]|uniref:hypothetical protein n=1 Tax=Streptosporangium sp. NPDC002544 TaxID=3154538 RepID=UPI0033333E53
MARDENMIAALKRERATYVSRGEDDRVAQVDEQLKHYGYEGTQDADPGAVVEPQGRTSTAGQRTAESGTPAEGEQAAQTGATSSKASKKSS